MQATLVFDGECGFCRWCAHVARRWVRPRARIEPWQGLDLAQLGLTPEQCQAALQWVDSRHLHGGRAVAAALQAGMFPWPLVGALMDIPVMRPVVQAGYRWVAERRHRLPSRLHAS